MTDEIIKVDCQGDGPEFVERVEIALLNRDKLKEKIAVAFRNIDGCGCNFEGEHVFCDDPRLSYGVRCATCDCKKMPDVLLDAAEASGYVLMPKDPTSEMIAKVHWLGETSVREVYAALMAGVKFKEPSDG